MPWKNGLGVTAEIAVDPPESSIGDGRFAWRLSIAAVERSCPFSAFPGYERTIMVIDGPGMELSFPGRIARRLDRLFDPFVFSGDEPAECRLIDGPIHDFNLMVDRARLRSRFELLRLDGNGRSRAISGKTLIVHCFAGQLHVGAPLDPEIIAAKHTLVIDTDPVSSGELQFAASGPTIAAVITLSGIESRE